MEPILFFINAAFILCVKHSSKWNLINIKFLKMLYILLIIKKNQKIWRITKSAENEFLCSIFFMFRKAIKSIFYNKYYMMYIIFLFIDQFYSVYR